MCNLPRMDTCVNCKCPLHFWALLNRDSFIHEFYNLPLDITPTSLPKALLDIVCPCVIFTVNSSNATGAVAVQLHACKRSAACRSDQIFSFGEIFISLLSGQVPQECCLRGTSVLMLESHKVEKLTFAVSWLLFSSQTSGLPPLRLIISLTLTDLSVGQQCKQHMPRLTKCHSYWMWPF